jgi:hypothetical protein
MVSFTPFDLAREADSMVSSKPVAALQVVVAWQINNRLPTFTL